MKGKGGQSALEFGGGVVVGFCFGGRRGPVSFRAVKGGESALELSCSAGNGGESASGLWRGDDVSQLWWWCCCRFLFWGAQGDSQLPGGA